jgi:hypothetical protein
MRKRIFVAVVLLVFFLSPVMIQALDVNVNLGYGEFYVVHRSASNGWRIIGEFTAENTIDFAICDVGNYSKWLNNQTPLLYEHYVGTSYSLNFTVPYDDDWYVVFSNGYSFAPNNLNIEVYYIDQTGTTQTQLTAFFQSEIVTPFLVTFIIIIVVVCLLGIWCARRKERQPAVRYEELLSVPE